MNRETLPAEEKVSEDRVAEHGNKSCPFCGLRNWRIAQRKDTLAMQVECASCGARGPLCIPDKAAAVAAWNDRI